MPGLSAIRLTNPLWLRPSLVQQPDLILVGCYSKRGQTGSFLDWLIEQISAQFPGAAEIQITVDNAETLTGFQKIYGANIEARIELIVAGFRPRQAIQKDG